MIDTKAIKNRILSLAYQGRLVNLKDNSPSNISLESIHSQIKGYTPVSEEEFLADAPAEWQWTRLGYVTSNHGQTIPNDTFSYIDVGTLDNVNHRLSSAENIVEAKNAPSRAKKVVKTGDVIYSTVRPYLHNICIIDKDFSYMPIASTAFCVMHAKEEVLDNKYLFYWLLTKEFDKYSNGDPSKGALYPAIGEKDLLKGVIPLPAVSEQKVIVAKIEAVFEILDKIDALQNQYSFNQEALKSKLIDAAIQGKLTEQLPEDGTAEELYEEIQKEKLKLKKDGKIKKDKPLPEITDAEIPFEIPENWKWYRLADISSTNIGLTYHQEDLVSDGTIVIRSSNIINSKMDYSDLVKVKCTIRESQYLNNNNIVICARNGSKALVGKCAVYEGDSGVISFGAFMAVLRTPCYKYIFYYLLTDTFRRYFHSDDSKQINQVTQSILKEAVIPLPPKAEQHRIVEKLDALLCLIT